MRKGSYVGLELPKMGRRLALAGTASGGVMLLSGCEADPNSDIKRLAMPVPSTREAWYIYDLWHWAWLAAMIVGVVVWGLIFYAIIRYRRRSETYVPPQTRYNLPIEIFYTVAPIMMVIVFFFFTVQTQNKALHDFDKPDQKVTVVGQEWSWTFNYVDAKAAGGKTVYDVGTTAQKPTLWLVKDAKTQFNLVSPDVIHSFWVPAFLFKMDVVPGRTNHFGLQPDREGTFVGRCAELCGVYHSRMLFDVKVVSQSAFDDHIRDLVKKGNVGLNEGNELTRVQPGMDSSEKKGEGE